MNAGVISQAAGLFAVTNFDDIVVLSLFFAQGAGQHGATRRVVAGQYLAFTAILAVSLSVAYGASFLPKEALPYLGLLPIGIGKGAALWHFKVRSRSSSGWCSPTAHTRPGASRWCGTSTGPAGTGWSSRPTSTPGCRCGWSR